MYQCREDMEDAGDRYVVVLCCSIKFATSCNWQLQKCTHHLRMMLFEQKEGRNVLVSPFLCHVPCHFLSGSLPCILWL